MRLKNIYRILKEVEPIISNKTAKKLNSGNYIIEDWKEVLFIIARLKNIELFKDVGQKLFEISPIFGENVENLKLTPSQAGEFNSWKQKIKRQIDTIIELCESIGYGQNEGSFEVKLPETNDFKEFSSNVNNLNRALQICPFIKTEDSNINLVKTDIGSTWLEFVIISTNVISILTALGYFVQSAIKIKSMYLTCEQQKELIRGVQIRNNLADKITDLYKDMIQATASKEVKELEEKLERPLEPEERNSAEKSLEILGKLMSKGLEIYATLDAPQEIKDIFPSMEQQKLLPDEIKLISENSSESTDL